MLNTIRLKKEYVKVRRKKGGISFGGDQNFFALPGAPKADQRKQSSGCGVVAFSDLLLYLAGSDEKYRTSESLNYVNRELSEEAYREYYNRVYHFLGGIPAKSGISGLKLRVSFNRMARKNGWKLRARWGLSSIRLLERIQEMIEKDIPVILCIPIMLRKKDKADKLALYRKEITEKEKQTSYRIVQKTSGHYVMVTGMVWEADEIYLMISSWGKEYYIRWKEYDTYINTHFLGKILGNILYIR